MIFFVKIPSKVFNGGNLMFFRTLFVLLLILQTTQAKLTFSSIQGQRDFLTSLMNEVDKENNRHSSNNKENKKNIDEYKKDIAKLQEALTNIEIENSKEKSDKKLLQEMVDEYNKKMKELERTYRYIIAKSKEKQEKEEYVEPGNHEIMAVDSLDYATNTRKIKKEEFKQLEIVELKKSSRVEQQNPFDERD